MTIDPAAVAADEPLGPGRYLLVSTDAWWMATGRLPDRFSYLGEVITRRWVPQDRASDWLMERQLTGRRKWICGSEEQAAAAGVQISDPWPAGRWRAPYGDFSATAAGRAPAPPAEPSWQTPTDGFLAALPRDRALLLSRLEADSPRKRPGYTGPFVYAVDALRTGLVPADLRAALYRALLLLPGTQLSGPGEVSGRPAILLSIDNSPRRSEILIDSANGQFAGERSTITQDTADLQAGTVTLSTTVTTTAVDSIGQIPSSQ